MLTYKDYRIERFERGRDRWIARVMRTDGRNVRIIVPASEHPFIETRPSASAEEAGELAVQGIDFGGIV
jgi:hypothetical protein